VNQIGERIQLARKRRGLSLRDLASQCGLSASFLSQVERNQSSPSIVSLLAVCEVLGVPVSDVLPEGPAIVDSIASPARSLADRQAAAAPVLRREDCPSIHIPNSQVTYHWLSGPSREHEIEVVIGEFPKHYQHPAHTHVGEEFGYLLEGEIKVVIDGESHELRPGDSYAISGARPHGFETNASGARVLWYHTRRFLEWYASTR